MDLYGAKDRSLPQKGVIVLLELALIGLSYAVLFGPVLERVRAFGAHPHPTRNTILFLLNGIVFVRFLATLFVFLRRSIPLAEAFSVPFAFALYLVGFPLMARGAGVPLNALDFLGVALFAVGSLINTVSEYQRHRFKQRPDSQGRLFTQGLFAYAMHINYFGDLLWVGGYACITNNPYAALVPVFLFCFFYFLNIPKLDAYLAQRYGGQFQAYARSTKRFIPFVL